MAEITTVDLITGLAVHGEVVEPITTRSRMRFIEKWPQWRDSFRDGTYTDLQVIYRAHAAVDDLLVAILHYRRGYVGHDEVTKRAADVVNQAAMAADRGRLRSTGETPSAEQEDGA